MTRLYLDLDGVMADFEAHHQNHFGWIPNHDLTEEQWAEIHASGEFFFDMPMCAGAHDLFQALWVDYRPIVLTACPRTGYQDVARQKRRWVQKHLGSAVTVLPVIGGHNKPMFMHSRGDILIDDYGKNCRAWIAEGGRAIKHVTAEQTLKELKAL